MECSRWREPPESPNMNTQPRQELAFDLRIPGGLRHRLLPRQPFGLLRTIHRQ